MDKGKPKHARISQGGTKKYKPTEKPPLGIAHQEKFAPHYVPHPTKTMWERHTEMHNIKPRQIPEDSPYVPLLLDLSDKQTSPDRLPPADLISVEQSIKEVEETGRAFTNNELRYHFNFSNGMISRFRASQRTLKKYMKKSAESHKRLDEKEERNARIFAARLDRSTKNTLADIAKAEGVSRECIRQIVKRYAFKRGIELPPTKGRWETRDLEVGLRCKVVGCNKIKVVKERFKEVWCNQFCDEHRMSKTGYKFYLKGAEWWKMTPKERERFRYHNDITRKTHSRESASRWLARMKSDREKYKPFWDKYKAYHKAYQEKKKQEARTKNIRPFIPPEDHGTEVS